VALASSCSLRARTGDVGSALGAFIGAIGHWQRLTATTHQLTTLRNPVVLRQRAGEPALVAELLGAVERPDVPTYGPEAERLDRAGSWASVRLGPSAFADNVARGRRLELRAAEDWAPAVIRSLAASQAGPARRRR